MRQNKRNLKENWKSILAKKVIIALIFLSIFSGIVAILFEFIDHTECYSDMMRYDLLCHLEDRDPEYIEMYQRDYIDDDIYLFDGELTYTLMEEKYGFQGCKLQVQAEKYGYEHSQDFYNEAIKPIKDNPVKMNYLREFFIETKNN